jgi:hypothetical protein
MKQLINYLLFCLRKLPWSQYISVRVQLSLFQWVSLLLAGKRRYLKIRHDHTSYVPIRFCSGNALDVYSGGIQFESRACYRLTTLIILWSFLVLPGKYRDNHDCTLQILTCSLFIFNFQSVRRYIKYGVEAVSLKGFCKSDFYLSDYRLVKSWSNR